MYQSRGQVGVLEQMLLLLIVIGLSVTLFLLHLNTLNALEVNANERFKRIERSYTTKLLIEDVYFNNSTSTLHIFVTNVGYDCIIDSLIVDSRLWLSGLNLRLTYMESAWINATFPDWFTLTEGLHEVLIVTQDGLKFKEVVYVGS